MQVAAAAPLAVDREGLDSEVVEREMGIYRQQAEESGKPAEIVDKMVEGRLKSFFAERVLLEQPYVKDQAITVGKYAEQSSTISRRVRSEFG